jgi:hypothetical protein
METLHYYEMPGRAQNYLCTVGLSTGKTLQNLKRQNDGRKLINLKYPHLPSLGFYTTFSFLCIYRSFDYSPLETEKERYIFPFHFIATISNAVIK